MTVSEKIFRRRMALVATTACALLAVVNASPVHAASSTERECLATAIYHEARGESKAGQAAVAKVILNRVKSGAYPNTICSVVYQNKNRRNACQFSFACDGVPDTARERGAWDRAENIAKEVMAGRISAGAAASATHYHADYVSPSWARKMKRLTSIGSHVFYRAA